eukprot:1977280-Pyramimonas_sp.AAC.1
MVSVNTCLDFDIQRDKPDHYPVVGAFRALHNKDITPPRDTIKRELTKDPHRREAYAILLRSAPTVHWNTNINEHYQ